jgi:hypothetical protein
MPCMQWSIITAQGKTASSGSKSAIASQCWLNPFAAGCIVITHGTDTIEETACGKRPPSDIGWVSRRSSQKVRFFHKDCVFASPSHILLAAISPDD